MAEIVAMPKMNLTMEEGYLSRLYKSTGESVTEGEPLFLIENEKEVADVESPASGTILRLWGEEGERYLVGAPLALIGDPGEDISDILRQVEARPSTPSGQSPAGKPFEPPVSDSPVSDPPVSDSSFGLSSGPSSGGIKMMPKIRKMIRDKGIDMDDLIAFIQKDRITEQDVLRFESAGAEKNETPPVAPGRRATMTGMRRAIARNMMESRSRTASLTNVTEADMTACLKMLDKKKKDGAYVSVTAAIIKACATALREHAIVNASLDGEEIVFHEEINIGCAVDLPGGLAVPVIRNADGKDVYRISSEIAGFAGRGRQGALTNADMAGGTFTVTNVGALGVEMFTPIIRYPQAAIMGVGAIMRLPRYPDDSSETLAPRMIVKLCLTYDHRIIDGAPAARFSRDVRDLLENPGFF